MNMIDLLHSFCEGNDALAHILTVHSTQVAEKALRVLDAHPELGADRAFVYEAAMLHDVGVVQCSAPRIHCFGVHHYVEHGYLGAAVLRELGYTRHALVAERHTGTGITAEQIVSQNLPIPMGDYRPVSIEEQVVCYADKFFSKTKLDTELTVERIRENLARFGDESVAKFDAWHEVFG